MSQKRMALEAVTESFGQVLGADEVKERVAAALKESASPMEIIQSLREGLEIVGRKYEAQEYFLSELIMTGMMAEEVMGLIRPRLAAYSTRILDPVVIGTVRGDIHDIGKKLVSTMLMSAGFEIVDVGVDIPAEDFVSAARDRKPAILAMSCLLTNAMDEMRKVVDALRNATLRGDLKVLVGGRPTSKEFAHEIGADGYGANAVEAVRAAKGLL